MRPNCDVPMPPHFCSLKSSVSDVGVVAFAFAFAFETFALALTLLLRFSLRTLAFRLVLLLFEPRLANAMSITTMPPPMTSITASPPSIHQIALDFLRCGAVAGAGVHAGDGGGWGGGGGGGVGGRGLTACGCGR